MRARTVEAAEVGGGGGRGDARRGRALGAISACATVLAGMLGRDRAATS